MTIDPVLISLVRKAVPNIIANDILGVQSMIGSAGGIFKLRKLRKKYSFEIRNKMNKALYKTFIRVNDRPRTQPLRAFKAAGYPVVDATYANTIKALQWCREQFGEDGYQRFGNEFVFKDENDAMAFRMRWL